MKTGRKYIMKSPKRFVLHSTYTRGTAVAQWLRCCATNRKVAVSIPAGVIGNFHWHKILSDRTMVLGSTQPLTEMSTRSVSWGKGGRCVTLTTLPPSCVVVTKSVNHNFLEHSASLQACNGTALPLHILQTGAYFASYVSIQHHDSAYKRNSQQRYYFMFRRFADCASRYIYISI